MSGLEPARKMITHGVVAAAVLSAACAAAPVAATVQLEEVVGGLTMPVAFVIPPDGSGRHFIAEQTGRIRVLNRDGELLEAPLLDLGAEIGELYEGFDERGR